MDMVSRILSTKTPFQFICHALCNPFHSVVQRIKSNLSATRDWAGGPCLEKCDTMQLGTHVYEMKLHLDTPCLTELLDVICCKTVTFTVTVLSFITLRRLNMSECAFKLNSNNIYFWESQNKTHIPILPVHCRILQTIANWQAYDVCECSCLQWICTGSVWWTCKPLPHGALQINNKSCVRIT